MIRRAPSKGLYKSFVTQLTTASGTSEYIVLGDDGAESARFRTSQTIQWTVCASQDLTEAKSHPLL